MNAADEPAWLSSARGERRPAAHWLEQADLAETYALTCPPSDVNGWLEAMRDRDCFLQLANASLPASPLVSG